MGVGVEQLPVAVDSGLGPAFRIVGTEYGRCGTVSLVSVPSEGGTVTRVYGRRDGLKGGLGDSLVNEGFWLERALEMLYREGSIGRRITIDELLRSGLNWHDGFCGREVAVEFQGDLLDK